MAWSFSLHPSTVPGKLEVCLPWLLLHTGTVPENQVWRQIVRSIVRGTRQREIHVCSAPCTYLVLSSSTDLGGGVIHMTPNDRAAHIHRHHQPLPVSVPDRSHPQDDYILFRRRWGVLRGGAVLNGAMFTVGGAEQRNIFNESGHV